MSRLHLRRLLLRDAALKGLFAAAMLACAFTPLLLQNRPAAQQVQHAAPEWPRMWDGRPLRPLAMSPVEQRFASRFPGSMVRMTDGQQVLVLRHVTQPTRMLHPAADCYRGLGYRIQNTQLEHNRDQQLQRCFVADNGTQRLRVCEQITDAQGQVFTDTSAWYWAALLQHSTGPWRATTWAAPL
jgi:hypothetical protein